MIILVDNSEALLTDQDISAFNNAENALILNESGIEKWKAYLGYDDIPKLSDGLYSKEFMIKFGGEEICQGKFWSSVSSFSTIGVIITDATLKLDKSFNRIYFQNNYPVNKPLDSAIKSKLLKYFETHNLIIKDYTARV
ncbi:hypothetical protein B1772_05335 [Dehalococcoides mccartyi]|jgi:hypothetical protein|uniref:hypothetical protein n=1 Tax=Dehalococcoides mccartyi TaxID=61435 RepID=UPI000804D189|nr:hypothetical protein [Dehalococcoides mccartyi]AQX74911.1 hypothetical protein B1776_05025 [Dehalococcoides mccartyi]AQY73487.1 hypothetical protein B1772_05335 [Dehalococcoides mccartyi]OBW61223.1 MAG: hypothetical protein A9183_03725 [Dehalococcoides mccartyi]